MSLLSRLTPINFLEEKEKFFLDQTYNPQFMYEETSSTEELLEYGIPNPEYVELAKDILTTAYYGRNEDDLFMSEGPTLSQTEVENKVHAFFKMHDLESRYGIVWSSSFVSRTTITNDTLKLRLPVDFRKQGLIGMLYHEIGTHAIRRINYEKQPWFKKKKKFGFQDYLRTEEGLATLHALIPHSNKFAFISAIRYLAVDYAQHHTFAELWKLLGKYIQDDERRWIVTFRQKRGVTDTSKPGGFTKDLVYFEGMVDTWKWLFKNDFKVKPLYFGKLAYQDVEKALEMNPDFEPLMPSFYQLDPDKYASDMFDIGKTNGLDKL